MPSFWKPLPQRVARFKKRLEKDRAVQRIKTRVRKRDSYTCRVCGRATFVVHEHQPRGAGGKVSLQNSFCSCDVPDGGLCHVLLQRHRITPVLARGRELPFDANESLVFEMTEEIAAMVFRSRRRPAHVTVLKNL